ncbi:MAG: transporter substrate-binding domain-containing protein [Shewanella sp.]|uniref:ABC transporter substrate-binding protein n=1 Tax=Shewanella sp. TaxID=50422 RepID=UPI0035684865
MKRSIITISCLVLFFISGFAFADTALKYNVNGSSSWVPYYIPDSPESPGILGELVPLLLAKANINNEKHNFPPRRTNYALDNGWLDFDFVSPSWFPNNDLGELFVQSSAIIAIEEYIITLASNAKDWQHNDNLKGQEIGTVGGYLYHNDSEFTRVDFTSEKDLIKALYKDRVKAAISGDLPALYWAKKLNCPVTLAALHSKGHLVMRLRKEHVALLPSINAAIAELQSNGTIDRIIDKYTQQAIFEHTK